MDAPLAVALIFFAVALLLSLSPFWCRCRAIAVAVAQAALLHAEFTTTEPPAAGTGTGAGAGAGAGAPPASSAFAVAAQQRQQHLQHLQHLLLQQQEGPFDPALARPSPPPRPDESQHHAASAGAGAVAAAGPAAGAGAAAASQCEGYLFKRGARHRAWKKRWLVLRDGSMRYWKDEQSCAASPDSPLGSFLVKDGKLRQVDSEEKGRRALDIEVFFLLETPARTWVFGAQSQVDLDRWKGSLMAQGAVRADGDADGDGDGDGECSGSSENRCEGYLEKKGGKRHNWKMRYFILQRGKMSYWRDAKSSHASAPPLGSFSVDGALLSPAQDKERAGTEQVFFQVEVPGRVYILRSASVAGFERWKTGLVAQGARWSEAARPQQPPVRRPSTLLSRVKSSLRSRASLGPVKIAMVGLDNAGKTTILYSLKLGQPIQASSTVGFNAETVTYHGLSMNVWDIGGSEKVRPLWQHFYAGAHALIFVVDSSDSQRFGEAAAEFSKVMLEEKLKNALVLVYANKQDLPGAASPLQLSVALKMDEYRSSEHILRGGTFRSWNIMGSIATTGVGLHEGLDWVVEKLQKGT